MTEAFFARFPELRPKPSEGAIGNGIDSCPKCAKAKSGYCSTHRPLRGYYGRKHKLNEGAWLAGEDAARRVDLGATGRQVES